MKATNVCLLGLVFVVSVSAEPLLEGRVRLESGEPVADAQVRLFDMTDLRQGAIARAVTDGTGYFALPLAALGGQALPARFALGPNYPNPFNPSTIIPYQLAASSEVRLEVFNLLGQHIATLVDGERPAGFHTATWHATDGAGRAVGAGVYIYRMMVGAERQTGRMVLIDGQAGVSAVGAASAWSGASGVGGSDGADAHVYGLIVSGSGLVPYVDSSFRVEAGMAPVELVVSSGQHSAGKATDDDCAFCDLFGTFNDQQEEEEDETPEEEEEEDETTEEEEDETDSTSSEGGPDLVVQAPSVSAVMLTPGQEFTLNVTVHNQGDGQAAATTLHYYRSNNATITSSDTEVGTDEIGVLDASATSAESITLTAPTGVSAEVGIYYGACVGSVSGESNTDNNCSSAVKITVSGHEAPEEEEEETPEEEEEETPEEEEEETPEEEEEETPEEEGADGQVSIPDAKLRAAIEAALGLPEGSSLTAKDLASLTELRTSFVDLSGARIQSLDGLEHCTALAYLGLYYHDFSDVGPLANLTNLTRLDLSGNQISDVGPLANLTNLTRLELNDNQISDVGPLANLTNLGILHLSDNKISDVRPLANLTRLAYLFLHDNQISDVGPLVNMTNLTELTLTENPLSQQSLNKYIPALQAEGVGVTYGYRHVPEPDPGRDPEDVFNIELRFFGDFTPDQIETYQEAARIWEGVVVGDMPSTTTERFRFEWTNGSPRVSSRGAIKHPGGTIDDLLIYVQRGGLGDRAARASILRINEENNIPVVGTVAFHERFERLSRSTNLDIALHEMGHVIGFSGGLLAKHGLSHSYQKLDLPFKSFYFTGFNAMQVFVHALGGDTSVLLDADGNKDIGLEMGDWTHWPDYYHDIMGPATGSTITVLTAAAFEDMGYTVNYSNAHPFYPSTRRLAPKISVDGASLCGGVKDLSGIPRE